MGNCFLRKKFEPNDRWRSQSHEALELFTKLGLQHVDVDLLYSAFWDIDSSSTGYISVDEFFQYFDLDESYMERFTVCLFCKDVEYLNFAQFVTTVWYVLSLSKQGLLRFLFLMKRQKSLITSSGGGMSRQPSLAEMVRQHSTMSINVTQDDENDEADDTLPSPKARPSTSSKAERASGSSKKRSPDKNQVQSRGSKKISSKIDASMEDDLTATGSGTDTPETGSPTPGSGRRPGSKSGERRPRTTGSGSRSSKKMSSRIDPIPEPSAVTGQLAEVKPTTEEKISYTQIKDILQLIHKCQIEDDPILRGVMISIRKEFPGDLNEDEFCLWMDRHTYASNPLVSLQQHLRSKLLGEIQWNHLTRFREESLIMKSPDFLSSLHLTLMKLARKAVILDQKPTMAKKAGVGVFSSTKVLPVDVSSSSSGQNQKGGGSTSGMQQKGERGATGVQMKGHILLQEHEEGHLQEDTSTRRVRRSESALNRITGAKKPVFVRTNSWSQQKKKLKASNDPTHHSRMYFKNWVVIRRMDACLWMIYSV